MRIKNLLNNKSGFTLTEVLVAVMVLVVAVVAGSNLLVSMLRSNAANTSTLQAYYYSQEGLEAFRNMRDTHFMHNVDYRGDVGQGNGIWGEGGGFSIDGDYVVNFNAESYGLTDIVERSFLQSVAPWKLSMVAGRNSSSRVYFQNGVGSSGMEETSFSRVCEVLALDDDYVDDVLELEEKAVSVTCTTSWEERGDDREVALTTILTDWKNE